MTNKPVISILGGTGAQGSALALRWVNAGYSVVIGSRNAQKAAKACEEISRQVEKANISHDNYAAAADKGEVVVLCVPYASQRETVESVREALEGKILIDATVPLVPPKVARVQLPEGGSAVAAIQAMLGDSVKVVSAFQNVAAHVLSELSSPVECDVLVCGNDVDARETVIKLAGDIGMRAIHAGPIGNSAAAEALTSILISINSRYKVSGAGVRITRLDTDKK
ncbi:MAG: NADPH-dependent F420 reductase [Betaproteobacteria bacterium]|nr:MAG: NADPH-dependent F420 reductase [Betaproteobacteria bacterium]